MINYGNIFDNEGLSYTAYRELVDKLLAEGKTTGPDNSEAMLHYTKMNVQRMNRVDKTTVLGKDLLEAMAKVKGKYHFLVISEGWCGDAAQIVPVINKLVEHALAQFDLKLVLRDQHLELIDAHLTNNGRAIPVLLVLNEQKELALPKWGPRPLVLQDLLAQWKKESSDMMLIAEQLHGWYAKDKTQSTQAELAELLGKLK
ncbi:thioredoxin family protein [Pedobacter sp. KR3-3]|uniref:Thioredoxin family protein n=1 Tax=Pedobacter albus TaxID=3113905 RepID=A0ABU7I9I0_9SPHI|nr:thioredoxin family protein [Pedobacter sp. KR3-3]MEE1946137.1 thioredoxin family protein [Pedobacter sp. KR3-3]